MHNVPRPPHISTQDSYNFPSTAAFCRLELNTNTNHEEDGLEQQHKIRIIRVSYSC